MPQVIAAIDQGTTSTRCLLIDRQGHVAGSSQREHRQYYPRPGWVEHDPMEIWQNTQLVIAEAKRKAGLTARDLAAIGIANQRETVVVWDKANGTPIHPAIVWQDTRTGGICEQLAAHGGKDRFRAKTGLPVSSYFSGPKLQWLLDHVDGARQRAERGELLCGTIDSWLLWNLTGGIHATDVTNASRTLLMNLATLDWDDELLAAMRIPRAMLPPIRPSSQHYGEAVGACAGSPVAALMGDQQAALFGQAGFAEGEAKNTYGTGCFLLLNTGSKPVFSDQGLLTTVAYRHGSEPTVYALEGSVAVAGSLIQWLRDKLGLIDNAAKIETLAKTVTDNGGIYIVPAFSGLFAPYWRADARGVIVGLTGYVEKGHFARAALEAIAYQSGELLDAMREETGIALSRLRVDGGMVANDVLMQFQADILDVPVQRSRQPEATALGAAFAAGLAVGFWSSLEELRELARTDREWRPAMDQTERGRLRAEWKKAVSRSFDWVDGSDG